MNLISRFFQGTAIGDLAKTSNDVQTSVEEINESVSFDSEPTEIIVSDENNVESPAIGSAEPSFSINETIYDAVDIAINSKVFQAMISVLKIELENTDEVLETIK